MEIVLKGQQVSTRVPALPLLDVPARVWVSLCTGRARACLCALLRMQIVMPCSGGQDLVGVLMGAHLLIW